MYLFVKLNPNMVKLRKRHQKTEYLMKTESPSTTSPLGKPVLASPSVRRFARELGCDLNKVNGLGSKGRITQDDVQKYIKARLTEISDQSPALPLIAPGQDLDFSKFGDIEIQPLNKIKKNYPKIDIITFVNVFATVSTLYLLIIKYCFFSMDAFGVCSECR